MNNLIHIDNQTENLIKESLPNNKVCNRLAYFYSIFSDTTRLRILVCLLASEMCVNDIANILSLNQTTVSHQLKILKSSGVVSCCRKNKFIFYKITDKFINLILLDGVDFVLTKKIV